MRVYRNAIMIMRIRGCKECPNKTAHRYKTIKSFFTDFVCKAIELEHTGKDGIATYYHPSIREALAIDGFLDGCPLEETV